jgi:hypothetical protein
LSALASRPPPSSPCPGAKPPIARRSCLPLPPPLLLVGRRAPHPTPTVRTAATAPHAHWPFQPGQLHPDHTTYLRCYLVSSPAFSSTTVSRREPLFSPNRRAVNRLPHRLLLVWRCIPKTPFDIQDQHRDFPRPPRRPSSLRPRRHGELRPSTSPLLLAAMRSEKHCQACATFLGEPLCEHRARSRSPTSRR